MNPIQHIRANLQEHIRLFQKIEDQCLDAILRIGRTMTQSLAGGGKILIAGNGGSAADAQHFAAELIGRFVTERPAMPAIALTTDSSILTAVSNDYGFDQVFSRQVSGLSRAGDVFLGISTSGNSANVIRAMEVALQRDLKVFALLGRDGGKMAAKAHDSVIIPATETARIQEAQQWVYHIWCDLIDRLVADTHPQSKSSHSG